MQITRKTVIKIVFWLSCTLIGYSTYRVNYSPAKPYVGFWSGQSIVEYQQKQLLITSQLVIDEGKIESAKLITRFEPVAKSQQAFQSNITAHVEIIKRNEFEATMAISDVHYTKKAQLEAFLERQLPSSGLIITAKTWATTPNELFMFITLPWGEEMGLVLNRHK